MAGRARKWDSKQMSAYCPECHWVGDEGDYPPCPSCGDGRPDVSIAPESSELISNNKLDVVTFAKLFDSFGELKAGEILNDVNEGRATAESVENELFTNESKDQYAQRLRDE